MATRPYHPGIPDDILALSHERDLLRRRGQYARADMLKRQIEDAGYAVKDNPRGAHLVILPSIETDGTVYRTARQLPSLLHEPDSCTFSIILLAHNTLVQTQRCIESIRKFAGNTSIEIILVDNASQDGLDLWAQAMAQSEPRLHVLHATRTMGTAAAYNVGFNRSRGQYILLLHPSIELTGDIFTPLAHTLADDEIGITGPLGLRTDDLRHFEESAELEVEVIAGQCMAFRRKWLNQVGLFDERYRFPQYMDVDFNFTMRDHGARAVVTPQLPIIDHADAQDTNLSERELLRLNKRNFYRFLEKWGNRDDLLLEEENVLER